MDLFRVLLVDDEELSLVALQHAFPWEAYGFTEIMSVSSSREALGLLRQKRIDAAFVDIRMPEISGLQLLAMAKEEGMDTSFVIVSGYSDFSYAREAIRYDVLDYCVKPVPPEEAPGILEKLSRHIPINVAKLHNLRTAEFSVRYGRHIICSDHMLFTKPHQSLIFFQLKIGRAHV